MEVIIVDCIDILTKEELLQELASKLKFPAYFGHNWDALSDCLFDIAYHGKEQKSLKVINTSFLPKGVRETLTDILNGQSFGNFTAACQE